MGKIRGGLLCATLTYSASCLLIIMPISLADANGISESQAVISDLEKDLSLQYGQTGDLSIPLSRIKRKEESEEQEDEEKCVRLPPTAPNPISATTPINLMEILNNGSNYMMQGEGITEAVLILGNTGSGKTTLTQIISGNLSRLHAVRIQRRRLVIVDDDNRIGAPSTVSKTLVPELAFDENGTAFYDCPGFDDTRRPEQDIAANFFINQIVSSNVDRVKLLFLVIHNSVTLGQDRLDFDLMVNHATKFIQNIPNYKKSIGLVITKVNSFDDSGKFVKDKFILEEIVQFLTIYLDDLRSKMELTSSSDESSNSSLFGSNVTSNYELERKIQFVEALLEKNENGKYGKISFSRSPTECGPLSDSKVVADTKTRLKQLYSQGLEYSEVHPTDFGYTLKYKTKLVILNYVTSLNVDITTMFKTIMSDFKIWLDNELLKTDDLISTFGKLKSSRDAVEGLLTTWNNFGNPIDVLEAMISCLGELGYSVPIKDQLLIKHQQSYFNFFDELNEGGVRRTVNDWSVPVQEVKTALKVDEEEAKLELSYYVKTFLNQNVTNEVSSLMNGFMDWFNETSLQETDLGIKLEALQSSTSAFAEALSLINTLGSCNKPEDFSSALISTIEPLGFTVPSHFQDTMQKIQEYFQLDDEANPPGINRAVKDWIVPITELQIKLSDLERAQMSLKIHASDMEISRLMLDLQNARDLNKFLQGEMRSKNSDIEDLYTEIQNMNDSVNKQELSEKKLQEENNRYKDQIVAIKKELAECGAKYFRDQGENTKLHLAVKVDDEQAVKDQVQLGADPNAENNDFETPIILAAKGEINGNATVKITKYLIEHGADAFAKDIPGQTFLHKLASRGSPLTPPQFQDMASYLVSKNLSSLFNTPDESHGRTPLMLAVENVELESTTLSLLHENGVDFTLRNNNGKSVLFYASEAF